MADLGDVTDVTQYITGIKIYENHKQQDKINQGNTDNNPLSPASEENTGDYWEERDRGRAEKLTQSGCVTQPWLPVLFSARCEER